MDKYTYIAVTNRIAEIKQKQLQILGYLDYNLEAIIDLQKENRVRGLGAGLQLFYPIEKSYFTFKM